MNTPARAAVLATLWAVGCGPSAGRGDAPGDDRPGEVDAAPVEAGSLSLTATINEVVTGSYCNPPVD